MKKGKYVLCLNISQYGQQTNVELNESQFNLLPNRDYLVKTKTFKIVDAVPHDDVNEILYEIHFTGDATKNNIFLTEVELEEYPRGTHSLEVYNEKQGDVYGRSFRIITCRTGYIISQ